MTKPRNVADLDLSDGHLKGLQSKSGGGRMSSGHRREQSTKTESGINPATEVSDKLLQETLD